jgi:PadR family transcriptional regulator AphA
MLMIMSLKHAILTLLETEQGSGYDLLKRFQLRLGFFWNASHQQIYAQLKSMHTEQLIAFELEKQTNRPDKKVYTLTEQGRLELQDWVSSPAKACKVNDALLVKLYAGHLADKSVLLEEMLSHRASHQSMLDTFLALESDFLQTPKSQRKTVELPYLTLRRGILGEQAWLAWADEVIDFIKVNGV